MHTVDENINTVDNNWDPRTRIDRRKNKMPSLRYILYGGRRRVIRRQNETINFPIIDKYDEKILIYSIVILILSLFDGYLTLYLSAQGAETINPLMRKIFYIGPTFYILFKFMVTLFSIICLQIFHKVKIRTINVKVEKIFAIIIFMFFLVNAWNLFILDKL